MLKFPPPIWMFVFLAAAGVASAFYPWKAISDWTALPLGVALAGFGALVAVWGRYTFHVEGTEVMPTSETNKKLVQHGPFAFTRNPMYLGLVIFSLGIAFCVGSLPMFAVPIALFGTAHWVHIPFEEAKMRRQFPGDFDIYAKHVRRWL
jgi:protein-S-isoprenylcysteine O-methyltransferase Ste14